VPIVKFISPRTVMGNRGDLLSRYGILEALTRYTGEKPVVFAVAPEDIGPLNCPILPYGPLYNLWPRMAGVRALREAESVVWTGGLDLQDDSSFLKLVHTWITFLSYRMLGKRIIVLMQGAGPLNSRTGRWLTRRIVNVVDCFVVRDTGTLQLLLKIGGRARFVRGHDGIFLQGLESLTAQATEKPLVDHLTRHNAGQPVVGVNIRLWYHFSNGFLPYQFAKHRYLKRAEEPMRKLIGAACELVRRLRAGRNARVVLISMYEPNSQPWEDDFPHLQQIKDAFADDSEVVLLADPLSMGGVCDLMRRLNLMIGARLHSTLAALRQGVPAINLAYTNKCSDILSDLGLAANYVPLETFVNSPALVYDRACAVLDDALLSSRIRDLVRERVRENEAILRQLFGEGNEQQRLVA
jgi:polysaccharide pyruvyl transferase WcaK-like protein